MKTVGHYQNNSYTKLYYTQAKYELQILIEAEVSYTYDVAPPIAQFTSAIARKLFQKSSVFIFRYHSKFHSKLSQNYHRFLTVCWQYLPDAVISWNGTSFSRP